MIGGTDRYSGKSDEHDFTSPREGAFAGMCTAYDYRVGKIFVLLLRRVDSEWLPSGPPFTRINEEVDSINSPWVIAIRHYVKIAGLNDYEAEKLELKKLEEVALKNLDSPLYPLGLAHDIQRHFQTPYPTRSYTDLKALFDAAPTDSRSDIVWALAKSTHPEAATFIRELIRSGQFTSYIGPVAEYVKTTGDPSTVLDLAAGYLRIKDRETRWPIMWALIKAARSEHMPAMLNVLKSADEEEAGRLGIWFVKHPDDEAREIIKKLLDGQYEKRWQLTFSLSGLGDQETLNWGKKRVATPGENRWIGYEVIADSPLEEADTLAKSIINNNDQVGCKSLVEGYGADGILSMNANPHRWDRLHDIISLSNKSKDLDSKIRTTLRDMALRGDEKAKQLLEQLK